MHERKRNETTTTTTTGADGKARRGTRYEHASSVLSALALLSELSRRERESIVGVSRDSELPLPPTHPADPCLSATRVLQHSQFSPEPPSPPKPQGCPPLSKALPPQPLVGCALAPLRAQSNPVEFRHARHHQLRIYTEAHAAKKIHLVTDDDAVSRVRLASSLLSHQRQRLPSLMHRGNPSNGKRQTRSRYAPRKCATSRRRVAFFSFLAKHLSYQP